MTLLPYSIRGIYVRSLQPAFSFCLVLRRGFHVQNGRDRDQVSYISKHFFNCKSEKLGYTSVFFRKMALNGVT